MSGGGAVYNVGVHLSATDGVSGVLASIAKSVLGLHGGVKELEHGFKGLKSGLVGAAAVAAGFKLGHLTKEFLDHGLAAEHWKVQMAAAGASQEQIAENISKSWSNAGKNMNATFADGLKNIIELNKATGDWKESANLLPAFSTAEAAMRSVKAEGLHDHFNSGTQTLNLARTLEEYGDTTHGKTEEERQARVEFMTKELLRTMISSRGLVVGNSLYAMANNSGGATQNWDDAMKTTIGPIIGEMMKGGKFGNAAYMATRTYKGGTITSKAVKQLLDYKMITEGDEDDKNADAYHDKQGYHLKPNSNFAQGIDSNVWDWSARQLEKLKANGYDVNNQQQMNDYVTATGSNKSVAGLMRMLLEPNTRALLQKEFDNRNKVPEDAAGFLQGHDPTLLINGFKNKMNDLMTVLGEPLVGPAMAGLDRLTHGISAFAQMLHEHPITATFIGGGTALAAGGATAYGSYLIGRAALDMMRGGGAAALTASAGELSGSAAALTAAAAKLGGASVASNVANAAGGAGGAAAGGLGLIARALPYLGLFGATVQQATQPDKGVGILTKEQIDVIHNRTHQTGSPLLPPNQVPKDAMKPAQGGIMDAVKTFFSNIGSSFKSDASKLPAQVDPAIHGAMSSIGAKLASAIAGIASAANAVNIPTKTAAITVNHTTNLDGKKIAQSTSSHLVAMMTHSRQAPYPDSYAAWWGPDQQFTST